MTLTIELTPEQEARLRAEAEAQGIDTVAYALRRLGLDTREGEQQSSEKKETTWGERVLAAMEADDAFGAFDDRPEDSPELARILRAEAEQRSGTL